MTNMIESPNLTELPCKICGNTTQNVGSKQGNWRKITYNLYRCPKCGYGFVGNPSTDYEQIYTLDYYNGRGADPLIDYVYELNNPEQTIRQYEWIGIGSIISQLKDVSSETNWLDFGCGNGGLVRWVKDNLNCNVVGFEEGDIANTARKLNISILSTQELEAQSNCYDVITAIEVLEHVIDPINVLQKLFNLLKKGGILFYTTGNASRYRKRLATWSYVVPEIHISFYEPYTLEYAMNKVGFKVKRVEYSQGFTNVIRFKILKNLGLKKVSRSETLLPWYMLSFMADRVFGVSAFPIGYKD
jgi:SAM-dependent methyltransferase